VEWIGILTTVVTVQQYTSFNEETKQMYTTLNEILRYKPCGQNSKGATGFSKLLKFLGKEQADDEPLSFITILESNGILDAIWCLRVLPDCDLKVMKFKLLCARRVEHLDESGVAKNTLDVLERFINGDASAGDLQFAAAAAAYAAAYADAAAAADAAAYAVYADAAADAAAYAAYAAAYADAAYAAARAAELEYQTEIFRDIFGCTASGGAGGNCVKSDGNAITNK